MIVNTIKTRQTAVSWKKHREFSGILRFNSAGSRMAMHFAEIGCRPPARRS
jgi:hypothetical protein